MDKVTCYFLVEDKATHRRSQIKAKLRPNESNMVTLKYKGELRNYYVDGSSNMYWYNLDDPTPIGLKLSAKQVRGIMDERWLAQLTSCLVTKKSFLEAIGEKLGIRRYPLSITQRSMMTESIAEYIKTNAFTEHGFYIITENMLNNIRQGGVSK